MQYLWIPAAVLLAALVFFSLAALYCVIRRNKLAEDAEIAARDKSEGGEHHA